jgi:mRNA interferase MazF
MIKRGDFFWVDLDPVKGSEQAGRRPVLIIQNNISNQFADSTVLLSQIRVFDKSRLEKRIGHLPASYMIKVDTAIKNSLALS